MEKQDPKLFARSTYSSTTISIFQIVGAYFVDVYYNHLYTEAVKFKTDGKVASVTEGYRHATFAFLSALDNKAKNETKELIRTHCTNEGMRTKGSLHCA